jgi:guanylate kinase
MARRYDVVARAFQDTLGTGVDIRRSALNEALLKVCPADFPAERLLESFLRETADGSGALPTGHGAIDVKAFVRWIFGMKKDIVVINGPSGVGKSTLIQRLMKDYPGRFGFSVSHATRQPREGEKDGVHYNFTSVEKMREMIANGDFIEYAEVHGNFYGTSIAAVDTVVQAGNICLLDIDIQGAQQLSKSSLDASSSYLFIGPPSVQDLESRLRGRGTEKEETIQVRLQNAGKEIAFSKENASFFGAVLVNDDLDKTYGLFREFIEKECGKSRLEGSTAPS